MSGIWQYGHYVYVWAAPDTLIMAHTHIIFLGGVMNMIIGFATWFFPRSKKGYQFYNPQLMWSLYWVLSLATIGRFIVEILAGYQQNKELLIIGFWTSVLQMIVLSIIFFQLWDRVVTKGSHLRETLGETF